MSSPADTADQRFRLAVEAAPCAMVMVNHEGKIVLVNAHTERLFGYSREELLDQFVEILVPVPPLHQAHSGLRRTFEHQPKTQPVGAGRDFFARRKDGSQFPVEVGLNPIETKEHNWLLAIMDISERKRAEEQLRESEERFRLALDCAPFGIVIVDHEGKVVLVNTYTEKLFGYSREELLGQSVEILVPVSLRKIHSSLREDLGREPHARPMSAGRDLEGCRKDGSDFPIEIGLNPIQTRHGAWVLASIMDVSERKHAEAQLQEVTLGRPNLESLGLLARSIAHDFNNLQSVIISRSEVVLENPDLDSSSAEEVREIRKVALHGSEIVHQLMIYVGEHGADLDLIDISLLIEDMQELLKLSISKRTRLITRLDKRLPAILANATYIRQMVMNLVINASEAIGDGEGIIDIATSLEKIIGPQPASDRSLPEGDYMRLVVSDTGCGMSRDVQRKIFDPFFTTKVTGRGVGLTIVQEIVRRYRGVVDLKSSPNAGTRFEILLPYARRTVALAGC
jgi:PAS domain S-box-containing protein